ncbi:hypothetical protein [Alishewanella aestuarii]|nr:hypothetical protein [Alishewanella aestuarii]
MNRYTKDLRKFLWKEFHKNPKYFNDLAKKYKDYTLGKWPKKFVDCVFQYDFHHFVDIFDIYILAYITTLLRHPNRKLAVFQLPVGAEPYPDKEIELNQQQLNMLKEPFSGEFWGGKQGEDGYVKWSRPIHCLARENEGQLAWVVIEANKAPLEVGYNDSGKFYRYLIENGICARWPYGQSYITVFVNLELIKFYSTNSNNFKEVLERSGESIEVCLELERNPLENWKI